MRRIKDEKQRLRKTRDEKRKIREGVGKLEMKNISKVTKVNLFVNVFENPHRKEEFDFCRKKNEENKYIDEIIEINGRPNFNEIFEKMREGEINIIANTDIYFDDTLKYVENIRLHECFALTRWEYNGGNITDFRKFNGGIKPDHSQDVWIFRGKPEKITDTIYLGIPGCDNRLAFHLAKRYELVNPSRTIRAIHVHEERARNYTPHNGIKKYKPPYKFVPQC